MVHCSESHMRMVIIEMISKGCHIPIWCQHFPLEVPHHFHTHKKGDVGPLLDDIKVEDAPFGDVHMHFGTFLKWRELLDPYLNSLMPYCLFWRMMSWWIPFLSHTCKLFFEFCYVLKLFQVNLWHLTQLNPQVHFSRDFVCKITELRHFNSYK